MEELDTKIASIVQAEHLDIQQDQDLDKLRAALGKNAPQGDLRVHAMQALERRLAQHLLQAARDNKLDPANLDDMETLLEVAGARTTLSAIEAQVMVQRAQKTEGKPSVAARPVKGPVKAGVIKGAAREFRPSITRIDQPLKSSLAAAITVKVVVKGNF